jgi:uncharacterized protein YjbI with pentapeptide repeats
MKKIDFLDHIQKSRKDFSCEKLSQLDLSGETLSDLLLLYTNLGFSNFNNTRLNSINLTGSTLPYVTAREAVWEKMIVVDSRWIESDFYSSFFIDLACEGSQFFGVNFEKTQFLRGTFLSCYFIQSNPSGVKFIEVKINESSFIKSNLNYADLRGVTIGKPLDFSGTSLIAANLSGLDLRGSVFTGANLTRANLSDCNLRDVEFSEAKLDECILRGTYLDRFI